MTYQLELEWIEEEIIQSKVDHYFLCNIDIPWEEDPLREYPDQKDRERLFARFHELILNSNKPFAILKGDESQRLQEALSYLNNIQ